MLILLFGTHIYLTIKLGFIQKYTGTGIKLSLEKEKEGNGDVSQFGALSTALAATIGTGNIVGVATAIGMGGPGAVLWMWLTGVSGMATKYSEALLAVKYRIKTSDGTMLGGPMYALEKGLGARWLAILFSFFTVVASFGIGNMVQANSIALLVKKNFGVPAFASGIIMSVITALVLIGGIKSIAGVCSKFVPFMAFFYIGGCLIILAFNVSYIIPAVMLILKSAFTSQAAAGGFAASTLMSAARYGVARGLFSNESGLGSAPIVAAAAQTKNPVRQALVSATGTFWDTVVICAITGLVIVTSIIKDPQKLSGLEGANLTGAAFAEIPIIGSLVLLVGLLTFVFSTILGWSYYGERALEYLMGKKAIMSYRFLWVGAVMAGSVISLPLVWDFSDLMNAMMAIPNLISLLLLSNVIVNETKKYLWNNSINEQGEGDNDGKMIFNS